MATEGKTLVIAIDNSKECLKAIDFAKEHFSTDIPIADIRDVVVHNDFLLAGYAYHLLHVQTHPIAASALLANADTAAIAYYGQEAWDQERMEATQDFLHKFFIPKASEAGATVTATILHSDPDGSSAIGAAICNFVEKHKPVALVLMKQNKSAVARFFVGSVTKYCATKCHVPVIIVPT